MTAQLDLFDPTDEPTPTRPLPDGLRYQAATITSNDERDLLAHIRCLPFREFEFHEYTGKRRVVSFGWQYDFGSGQLRKADAIPDFLLPLRALAADFAGLPPASLQQVLVSEYGSGAGIGWHRDKAVFGQVVGVSLLAPCVFRLRRAAKGKWERTNLTVEPRSVYLLDGPARSLWEHSIRPVKTLRYSVTFRTLRQS